MATSNFKRPADPPQLGGSAKRPAPAALRPGESSPPSDPEDLRKEIANLRKREANLLLRLSRKEAEVQNLLSELQSLAPLLHPDSTNLTNKLLDPALLTLHVALRASLAEKDARIARLTEDLAAREFTPQGIIGKRLIGRMKALQNENEELGKLVYGGRMEGLEVELGLAKKVASEAKTGLIDANSLIVDLDNDLESLQTHLYNARAELKWYYAREGRKDAIVKEVEIQTDEPEPEPERYEEQGGEYEEEYRGEARNYRAASDGGDYPEQEEDRDRAAGYNEEQEGEGEYDEREPELNAEGQQEEIAPERATDLGSGDEPPSGGVEGGEDAGMQMDQADEGNYAGLAAEDVTPENEEEGAFAE